MYLADSGEQAVIHNQAEMDIANGLVQDEDAFFDSHPMDFSRYQLCFGVEDGKEYTLSIDSDCVFNGDLTGERGNYCFLL